MRPARFTKPRQSPVKKNDITATGLEMTSARCGAISWMSGTGDVRRARDFARARASGRRLARREGGLWTVHDPLAAWLTDRRVRFLPEWLSPGSADLRLSCGRMVRMELVAIAVGAQVGLSRLGAR